MESVDEESKKQAKEVKAYSEEEEEKPLAEEEGGVGGTNKHASET